MASFVCALGLGCSAQAAQDDAPEQREPAQSGALEQPLDLGAPEPESEPEPRSVIELYAAEQLVDAFVALDRDRVAEAELPALFRVLARESVPLCRHMNFDEPLADEDLEVYMLPPGTYRNAPLRSRRSLIAGCWNFVRMNDRSPQRDLELLDALYDAPSYDCTSVGVMQPYFMQHYLGCARMTMLDFDWQIHRVHAQLLEAMRAGELGEDLSEPLANMSVGWIAHFKAEPEIPLAMDSLCRAEVADTCAEALRSTQAALPEVERVTLALAGLHDAPFEPVPAGRQRVLYLSNALERAYTTNQEFTTLMSRVAEVTRPDEVSVIIHHAGGQPSFGIYELRPVEGAEDPEGRGWEVRTRCRDPYLMSVVREHTDGVYETWLEDVSINTEDAPTCDALAVTRGI